MTRWGRSFISNIRPTIAGSAPNFWRQYLWLRISTASAPRLVIFLDEARPRIGRDAQEVEEVVGHDAGVDAIGLAAVEQIEVHLVVFDQPVEHFRLLAVVVVLRDRDARICA